MSALTFVVPAWWPVLLALPVAALVGLLRQRRRDAARRLVLGPRLAGRRRRSRIMRAVWWPLFLLAAAVAALHPVAGLEEGEPAGPEVVFCIDVSWSMAAQDVPPARLARAVAQLGALAEAARGARFGLVAFAGEARLEVPLTGDVRAVAVMAEQLAPGAELRGGTDLGAAIGLAAAALQRGAAPAGSIVLLTDGEDFAGAGRRAAAKALGEGWEVHCVGYGTELGSKIAVAAEGEQGQRFLRDASGQEVISALDSAALAAVAGAGGGEYADGADEGALASLYADRLVPRAEAAAHSAGDRQLAHRFQWPLFTALLLWMLRLLVPERGR